MNMSIVTENANETSLVFQAGTVTGTGDWLLNVTTTVDPDKHLEIAKHLTADDKSTTTLSNIVKQIVLQSTTEIAQNLQDLTTRTFALENYSQPEVTIRKPEVLSESDSFGTAEKVVVGAAVIVACLALTGILLRLLGPYFRSKSASKDNEEEKINPPDLFISKLSYTNLGADIESQSSGTGNSSSQDCSQSTGSSPVTDWSELSKSSTGSRSSSEDSEENMSGKHKTNVKKSGKMRGGHSSTSLSTTCSIEDRNSAKGSPALRKKLTDEQMSIISTQSLEPLRMEQQYRDRWDDQFDPCGSLPRGNLSYHSHPSESRLSVSSMSSGGSYPTFPIPSKELVRQIHMDKERRYPSNAPAVKKEKHVRLSPPYR
ncbi:uncharacterized protein LOC123542607 [Mercenaria mercenaria]|uniref:uncharacterized protein LOC123542607 n=1 Tax=Mercenaria mercenaria TaxID=6596 RepID=UPI00234E64ED|nr:uncharacterized protein LOC123542607 [Mercenaria mercenaria]XP_045184466.2 uncharacterized protein LOC123542607 [Mercenaria mercenaria]XP_045184467.2 uncharacterized protein LOC123542607 [Mercenaria mercenaria]